MEGSAYAAIFGVVALVASACVDFEVQASVASSADASARALEVLLVDVDGDGLANPVVRTQTEVIWLEVCGPDCLVVGGSLVFGATTDMDSWDFDGDGADDVVVAHDMGVDVFFGGPAVAGRPAGLAAADTTSILPATSALVPNLFAFGLADINRDGLVDVMLGVTNEGALLNPNWTSGALGLGGRAFGPIGHTTSPRGGYLDADFGDFDGDGLPEMAVDAFCLCGPGFFSGIVGADVAAPLVFRLIGGVFGDVDGDGDDDVVFADRVLETDLDNVDEPFTVMRSAAGDVLVPPSSDGLLLDFDGDNFADIVSSVPDEHVVRAWTGIGTGQWPLAFQQPPFEIAVGGAPGDLAAGDVDGDGKPEVLVALPEADGARVVLLHNVGDLTFPNA